MCRNDPATSPAKADVVTLGGATDPRIPFTSGDVVGLARATGGERSPCAWRGPGGVSCFPALAPSSWPSTATHSKPCAHLAPFISPGVDPTRARHASTITLKPAPTGDFLNDYPLGGVTYVRLSVSLPPGRQQARSSMIGSGWSSARRSQMRSTRLRGIGSPPRVARRSLRLPAGH